MSATTSNVTLRVGPGETRGALANMRPNEPYRVLGWAADAEGARWNGLFLDVMEATLAMPSDPCRESAIHGLGHIPHLRERAEAILSSFLAGASGLRPEILQYARAARTGCVN